MRWRALGNRESRRLSSHGSARINLCTPRADKCTVGRHEPCDHRWHELGGLDLLAMRLRKNFGIIRTLWACLTSVISRHHASANATLIRTTRSVFDDRASRDQCGQTPPACAVSMRRFRRVRRACCAPPQASSSSLSGSESTMVSRTVPCLGSRPSFRSVTVHPL
jgi:hypothetical protein